MIISNLADIEIPNLVEPLDRRETDEPNVHSIRLTILSPNPRRKIVKAVGRVANCDSSSIFKEVRNAPVFENLRTNGCSVGPIYSTG